MLLPLPSAYYESDTFTVRYDLERSLGMAIWKGKFNSAELHEAFLICVHVIEKFGITRWLGHNRKMKGFSEEDKLWVSENVVPSLVASSLRRMATIPSEDEQQVAAIEYLIQRAGDLGDLVLRDFNNEEEAMLWLMQD